MVIMIMNFEYILLISLNAMQIKASSDVAYDFNQVIYAVCAYAPPCKFRPLHCPGPSRHVKKTFPFHPWSRYTLESCHNFFLFGMIGKIMIRIGTKIKYLLDNICPGKDGLRWKCNSCPIKCNILQIGSVAQDDLSANRLTSQITNKVFLQV